MAGRWFSPGTPVSSTNKTDRYDITETLLKVALNTTPLTQYVILRIITCQVNNKRYRILGHPKNGQSRETGNIGYTRGRQTKQKHNTIPPWYLQTLLRLTEDYY